jgi:predicted RNase H-like nuclease (RuvC/YqgF family)
MDLAERLEKLAEDVARLGSDSETHSRVARALTSELANIRSRVDLHSVELERLGETVSRVHALTREIRDQQGVFADDTAKHVQQLHRTVIAQGEVMRSVHDGVSTAVAASNAQSEALAVMSRARKTFALAPTLIGLGLFLAGLVAGLFR